MSFFFFFSGCLYRRYKSGTIHHYDLMMNFLDRYGIIRESGQKKHGKYIFNFYYVDSRNRVSSFFYDTFIIFFPFFIF